MTVPIKAIQWYDYITINIYWFAIDTRSGVLAPLVIPLMVQQFVGEGQKGAYVGSIRLWALMTAVLVQSVAGLLSDRSISKWGRRRPFIFAGTWGEVAALILIGLTTGLQGLNGFWALFAAYILSMVFSNTAQAGLQGFIPDLVPDEMKGRFSGVKALLEVPLPLVFISFIIGRLISAGDIWAALVITIVVLLVCMLVAMLVKEQPLQGLNTGFDRRPFARLFLMAVVFTTLILLMGEMVSWLSSLVQDQPRITSANLVLIIGIVGMLIVIIGGVWASIRIGIGKLAHNQRSFTWWVINRLAFLAATTNIATFLLFFIQERFDEFPGSQAALPATRVLMVVGLFVLLLAIPSGWLADRFGKKRLVALSGISAALGVLAALLLPDISGLYIGGVFIGAGIGLFYPVNWALGTIIVPPAQAGRYLGISNLAGAGAGAVGAYIGGPIADKQGYVVLFAIFSVLFLVSSLALLGVDEKT